MEEISELQNHFKYDLKSNQNQFLKYDFHPIKIIFLKIDFKSKSRKK